MLHKEDGKIDWSRSADVLARKVRAFTPWPGAYTNWGNRLLKIISANTVQTDTGSENRFGKVSLRKENGLKTLAVATGNGLLIIEKLQLEGKKVMSADEFLRGYSTIVGETLG
jgi:methionyl-tRNA formyltransferase